MQVEKIITLYVSLQNVIYQIDEITDTPLFKQELKRFTNSYLMFLEKFIYELDKGMDLQEADQFVNLVSELNEFTKDLVTKVIIEK
jgi:hypothetical protein